ncbi:MAG: ABC transporter substrate-binding protein [Proteobacteria bacterium]|nr:MAG: ABC transporter substrate-binding protein [Pseudomonadota bacterium]
MKSNNRYLAVFGSLAMLVSGNALAEQDSVRIVKTPGFSALPVLVMEHDKLFEKHLEKRGLEGVTVEWQRISGGALVNDAVLAGNVDIASGGIGPLATIWSKTKGTALEVKGIGGVTSQPINLNCRNPEIKSITDLNDSEKIALPAVKVSIQAVMLQMASAQEHGMDDYTKYDRYTVSMPSADAIPTLLSGTGAITCHMAAEPHHTIEVSSQKVHTVFNTYEVLGGPHNISLAYTTSRFREENPNIYGAYVDALKEAQQYVTSNKKRASEIYVSMNKEALTAPEIEALLDNENIIFDITPLGTAKTVNFMNQTGALDAKIESWRDMFFPEVHSLNGN